MINVRLKDNSGTQAGAEMHERDSVSGRSCTQENMRIEKTLEKLL